MTAHTYSWGLSGSGSWNDAASWLDITTAPTPASSPPDAGDVVEFPFSGSSFTVDGPGTAASVQLDRPITLSGDFSFTSVLVSYWYAGGPVFTGGTVNVGTVEALGTLVVDAGAFSADIVTLGSYDTTGPGIHYPASGWMTVRNGASVTLGSLQVFDGPSDSSLVSLDAGSILEIGNAGTAAAGTLTVDAGASVTGEGTIVAPVVLNHGTLQMGEILGTVINDGTLSAVVHGGTNYGLMSGAISNVVNYGTISGGTVSHISGPGAILVGSELTLGPDLSGTIVYDQPGGRVITPGSVSAGSEPSLSGLSGASSVLLPGVFATSVSYTPSGGGSGVVTLWNNGSAVSSLELVGDYSSALLVPLDYLSLGDTTQLFVAQGTLGAGSTPPSGGIASSDSFGWAGGAGDWGDASHWQDINTGSTVAVAPGIGNTATISLNTGAQIVSGQGEANDLTLLGQVLLGGIVTTHTLHVGLSVGKGAAYVLQGATLTATDAGHVDQGRLAVRDGVLNVAGGLSPGWLDPNSNVAVDWSGALEVSDGGTAWIDNGISLLDGGITLDGTSVLEIGSSHSATAGTLTVDADGFIVADTRHPDTITAGAILNAGTIANVILHGSITNNGLLRASTATDVVNNGLVVDGTLGAVSGTGSFEISDRLTINAIASGSGEATFLDASGSLVLTDASFVPVIAGFTTGDLIELDSIAADGASYTAGLGGVGTLTLTNAGTAVASLTLRGDFTGHTFYAAEDAGAGAFITLDAPYAPCFASGTRIRTPGGDVPVEQLRVGDMVATRLPDGVRPVRWLGHRTVRPARHPDPGSVRPVRVPAGSFGRGLPVRDLYLSPDHAVFAEDVLIPVKHLVGYGGIAQVDRPAVTYWHVELDRHDVILAEGMPVESYLDTGDRMAFANGGDVVALQPRFGPLTWEAEGCAPLAVTGPALDRVRAAGQVAPPADRRLTASATACRSASRRTGSPSAHGPAC